MTATTTRTFGSEPSGQWLLSLAAACAAPGVLHAQPSLPPVTPQFAHVQWLVPAAASNIRQTAAEEEMGLPDRHEPCRTLRLDLGRPVGNGDP